MHVLRYLHFRTCSIVAIMIDSSHFYAEGEEWWGYTHYLELGMAVVVPLLEVTIYVRIILRLVLRNLSKPAPFKLLVEEEVDEY